jgi:phosphoglycolate phosphatase
MHGFTIVFDLDGTLVDTAPDLLGGIDLLLREKGLRPVPHDLIQPLISVGSRIMLKRALEYLKHPLDEPTYEAWWARYLEIYAANIAVNSRPFPGLVPVLERLRSRGATLAVCTNKSEVLSHRLLGELGLAQHFKAVAGRDTFVRCYKPNPEHLLGTLRLAGGVPHRAVMVGDSDIDVQAARNAGVPVIGVTFGYTPEPIAQFHPDAIIAHYDDFEAALAGIRGQQT